MIARHPRALPLDAGLGDVRRRADDDAGPLEQVGLVAAELVEQDPLLLRGRAALGRREVDEHDEHSRPLDVAQEPMPEPAALARALDEAGDVRDHHLEVVVEAHDTEVWLEGRERVVADLGLGSRDPADERALARVREADQRDVGHEPQLEQQPLLLSTLPLLRERRRSPRVGEEPCVAASASASCRGEPAIAMVDEVGEQRATFHRSHRGALRHGDNRVLAPGAVASLARAVGAVGRPPVGMVAESQQ